MELGEIYESTESDVYLNLSPPPRVLRDNNIRTAGAHVGSARWNLFKRRTAVGSFCTYVDNISMEQ